ncbi:MAG: hypothetical protein Fur0037_22890 [Planctomycetota bacterium]
MRRLLLLAGTLACPAAAQSPLRAEIPACEANGAVPSHEDLDAASARGLAWLAARQLPCGAWTGIVGHKRNDDYLELPRALPVGDQRKAGHGHMGVTALCGMAFLAGGHLPDRGRYRQVVHKALSFILDHAEENGYLTDSGTRMYGHAFATLFLAEACGSVPDPRLKQALERAVDLIVDSQNALGGWRYNAFDRELDLSVTVCQLQALRSARNIGIRVPDGTIERALAYVRRSRVDQGPHRGRFYYKIHGRGAYQKDSEFAINAAALTALACAGVYDEDLHDPALDFLENAYGEVADYYGEHFYFWYGNYYACQAFFQRGGPRFARYYGRLCRDVLDSQQKDGRWRNSVGPGDEFSTAMACILLQVDKQLLPIFQR